MGKRERILLIDGYNVIFADEDLRATFKEDQDAGRRRLLETVSRYATGRSIKAVVVFDGGRTEEGRIDLPSLSGVETVFVRDADRYIRGRVSRSGGGDPMTVVSSDEGHVAGYSRRMGARVIQASSFLEELRKMDRSEPVDGEKPREESKSGVEYWLRQFGSGRHEE